MALRLSTKRKADALPSDIASLDAGSTAHLKPSRRIIAKSENAADHALQEVLNRLPHAKERCVDVETTGLDPWRNAIVGYVVTFSPKPQDSYYIPFRHAGKANVGGRNGLKSVDGWDGKLAPGEKELVRLLDQPGTTMIGHNLAFDLRFLAGVGFKFRVSHYQDSSINEPLLDEYARYSLEACATRHGVQAKKGKEIVAYLRGKFPEIKGDKQAMGHYWRLSGDDRIAVEYATGDGTSTWQLCDAQMAQIRKQEFERNGTPVPTLELVHSVESRLIPVLARMMVRGVKIDEERLETIIAQVGADAEKLLNDFPPEFNALSKNDVQRWMEHNGHTDWPHTPPTKNRPDGTPSFTEKYLKTHPAGQKVLDLRKLNNLNSSFCVPLRDSHMFKGRVHTSFNQLRNDEYGTVTGRLSSNSPNLQQVPKHNEELGRLIRSVYVPDFGIWGERDYSQVEPRLMAWYTRAKVFLDDYRNNPDADSHTAVAKSARPDWDQMDKAAQKHFRNTWAKRVNQTVITGGGKTALMTKYGMSESEALEAIKRYRETVPELQPFQQAVARTFRRRGWVMDVLGRRAHMRDPDKDYTGMNRLLQMSNASMLKLKMVETQEYLDGETKGGVAPALDMLINCHDALSFQFDEGERARYNEIKSIMEDFSSDSAVIKFDLPMRVDEGEGANWAEASYD